MLSAKNVSIFSILFFIFFKSSPKVCACMRLEKPVEKWYRWCSQMTKLSIFFPANNSYRTNGLFPVRETKMYSSLHRVSLSSLFFTIWDASPDNWQHRANAAKEYKTKRETVFSYFYTINNSFRLNVLFERVCICALCFYFSQLRANTSLLLCFFSFSLSVTL